MSTAADVILAARKRAGLTQYELARAAGTSQPAISRYEQGDAEPSPKTLRRILRACHTGRRPSEALLENRSEVVELLRKSGATKMFVFGSVARGEDTEESDVDIFVDRFDLSAYVFGVPTVEHDLEELLGFPVDVGEASSFRPRLLAAALADAKKL